MSEGAFWPCRQHKVRQSRLKPLKYAREGHMWKSNCGHQISSQIKIRQLFFFFFLPAVSRVSLVTPHCPSVQTTAPVTHLDVLSTLKQHQLKGRTNQSVTGEHIRITIKGLQKTLTFLTPFSYFFATRLLASPASPQPNGMKSVRFSRVWMEFDIHELRAELRTCLLTTM